MLNLLLWAIIFLISMVVLIKASDSFTYAAEKIGLHLGISSFVVGVVIVSIGTSLPELISSLFAVFKNSSEIVIGNVMGSNITNILLVVGVAAIFSKKLIIHYKFTKADIPTLLGSALLLTASAMDGKFELFEAIILILFYLIYVTYTLKIKRKQKIEIPKEKKRKFNWKIGASLVISSLFIYIGAKYTIESVIIMSEILNIGKEIIAILVVSLGTSLPELSVSVAAARKGKADMAMGNILGSNIFNSLIVMGIPSLFMPLTIPTGLIMWAAPIMIISTLAFIYLMKNKKITKTHGVVLLVLYALFVAKSMNFI
ncbi:calcium/sodium antiporter [archaeon]|jgi:cation:H+ antiporter|nr:calcium/sodium antiporter [archaeon]